MYFKRTMMLKYDLSNVDLRLQLLLCLYYCDVPKNTFSCNGVFGSQIIICEFPISVNRETLTKHSYDSALRTSTIH